MSDTDGKVKIQRNPARNLPVNYKPYVPQWQIEGREPQEYHGAVVSGDTKIARPTADNPRMKRAPLRQPYAPTDTTSPIGRGKGPVPNVGNNMEHTWSSVDGDIVDDLTGAPSDPNEAMVDNNNYVTDQAFGYQSGFTAADISPPGPQGTVKIEDEEFFDQIAVEQKAEHETSDLLSIVYDLAESSFLLIVAGVPVCSGPQELIEEQAHLIVSGEHEMCDGNPVPVDDIVILKRVKVKVGLFLE